MKTTTTSRLAVTLTTIILLCATVAARAADLPRVNVNTANETELAYLPGVGAVIAGRIVEWRHGVDDGKPKVIKDARELLDVKGIGEKTLARMLPYVALTGPTTAKAKIKGAKVAGQAVKP